MLISKICPVCQSSEHLHRSRARNMFERFLKYTNVFTIYRCHNCGWRGLKLRKIKFNISFINFFKFILVVLIVFLTVQYFIKKYLE